MAARVISGATASAAIACGVYTWAEKQKSSNPHPGANILNATVAGGVGGISYAPFDLHRYLTVEHKTPRPGFTWKESSKVATRQMFGFPGQSITALVKHFLPKNTVAGALAGGCGAAVYELIVTSQKQN